MRSTVLVAGATCLAACSTQVTSYQSEPVPSASPTDTTNQLPNIAALGNPDGSNTAATQPVTLVEAMEELEGAPYVWGGNHGSTPKEYVRRFVTAKNADSKRRGRAAALDCSMAVSVAMYLVDGKNITYANVTALQADRSRTIVVPIGQAREDDIAIVKNTHSEVITEDVDGSTVHTAGATHPGKRLGNDNHWTAYNMALRMKTNG